MRVVHSIPFGLILLPKQSHLVNVIHRKVGVQGAREAKRLMTRILNIELNFQTLNTQRYIELRFELKRPQGLGLRIV